MDRVTVHVKGGDGGSLSVSILPPGAGSDAAAVFRLAVPASREGEPPRVAGERILKLKADDRVALRLNARVDGYADLFRIRFSVEPAGEEGEEPPAATPESVLPQLTAERCAPGVPMRKGLFWLGADGAWVLLVYDARRGLWYAESGVQAVGFTRAGESLYALSADGTLWDLTGHDGTQEECVSWMGESGDLGLSSPENRYLQRLDLRMALESGSGVRLYVSYDGGASWELRGSMQAAGRVQDCLLHAP